MTQQTPRKPAPVAIQCGPEAARVLSAQVLAATLHCMERLERERREREEEWRNEDEWIPYTIEVLTRDVEALIESQPEYDELICRLYTMSDIVRELGKRYSAGEKTCYGRMLRSLGADIGAHTALIETVMVYGRWYEVAQ